MTAFALLTCALLSADPSATAEEVKKNAGATVDATKRYATEKKDEFVARMNVRLKAAQEDLNSMKRKAEAKSDAAAADLEEKQRRASAKLDELGKAGGNAWSSLKSGVEHAVDDLENGVQRAKQR